MTEQVVTLRIRADATQLKATIQSSKAFLSQFGGSIERVGDGGSAALQRVEKQARQTESSMGGLGARAGGTLKTMLAFAGVTIGLGLLSQLSQMADAYRDIQSRLELVSGSEERYAAAQSQTYAIAQRTFTSLESTASLYGRMQRATDDLGRSQGTALRTTELINKTYQISGTSAAAAAGSIMQLSQGLGAGALRGDEFNSVMEGAPRLALALADSLGVGTGELRAMAEQGQLTADKIIDALESQGDAIDAEFGKLKITNARAWQQVQTAAIASIGAIADKSGAVDLSAGLLQSLARGIEKLPAVMDVWGDTIGAGFGQVIDSLGTDTNSALADLGNNTKGVLGQIADEFLILPVSMRTVVGVLIGEVHKFIISAYAEFDLIAVAADETWVSVKEGVSSMSGAVRLVFAKMVDGVIGTLADLVAAAGNLAAKLGADDKAREINAVAASLQTAASAEKAVRTEIEAKAKVYADERTALAARRDTINKNAAALRAAADDAIAGSLAERDAALERVNATGKLIDADDKLGVARQRAGAIDKEAAKAAQDLFEARAKNAAETRLLAAQLEGPLALAQEKHRQSLAQLRDEYEHGRISVADYTERQRLMQIQMDRTTGEITKQGDVLGNYLAEIENERAFAGMTERQLSMAKAVARITKEYRDAAAAGAPMVGSLEDVQRGVAAATGELYDYKESLELAKDAAVQSQRAWQEFGESLVDYIADGADGVKRLWRDMLDYLKRQLIASGIQSLLQSLFNVNVNLTGSSAGGGGGIGFGQLFSLFGGGGGSVGGGALGAFQGQGISGLFSGSNWLSAGQSMWSGFSNGFSSLGSMFGLGSAAGAGGLLGAAGTTGLGSFVGAGSLGWTGASGLGAAGFGGTFGGGVGAYGAGASASGVGSAATSAAAVPIVGWIIAGVLANMALVAKGWDSSNTKNDYVVDAIFAGFQGTIGNALERLGVSHKWAHLGDGIASRLFGRQSPKATGYETNFTLGDEGVGGTSTVNWRSKGGIFRSDKKGQQVSPLADDALADVAVFWETIRKAMKDIATELGSDVAQSVSSSFRTVYDKDGKTIKSQSGTIAGRTYDGISFEDFQTRVMAENIIAAVGMVSDASALAERWRGNAQSLLEGAQFLLVAQSAISKGNGLFGADSTLGGVTDYIESIRGANESLLQTYQRVATSVALLDQAYGLANIASGKTREEFVKWSTDLVEMLGGVDAANAKFSDFFNRYFTAAERTQYAYDQISTQATGQFRAAGFDISDFQGDTGMAAMRDLVEGALASGNSELIAQYLDLASMLGLLNDASAALNATLGAVVGAVAQTAEQLANVQAILDKNDWDLATASMSDAQRAIRDITERFAEQRTQLLANAATQTQLAQLDDQRMAFLRQGYDQLVAGWQQPSASASTLAQMSAQIDAWVADQIAQAQAWADAMGLEGIAAEDLAALHENAAARLEAARQQFQKTYDDFVAQFRPDTALPTGADASSVAEAQAQADAWAQSMIDQANTYAIAAGMEGAAAEDLINIHNMAADAVRRAAERIADALVQYNDFINGIRRQNGEFSQFQLDQQEATRWYDDAIAKATALARAAGLAGIAEGDLGAIELRVAQMRAEALRVLEKSALDLIGQLQGPASGSLASLNAQIAQLEDATNGLGNAVEDTAQRWLDAIRGVRDFLDAMLLNPSTTTLTPEQQLAEVQRQYEALLAAAQGGDANAASQLPAMAQQYLDLARSFYSSGDQYQAIFDAIRDGLGGLAGMPVPGAPPVQVGPSPELIALYEERDRLMAEQEAAHRLELAQQLQIYIRDIISETGESLSELAQRLGINMTDFVEALGVSLDNVTTSTVQQLATLAATMGTTVMDLADAVGLSLGDLADRQSLLNQAVQATITGLPSESADALQPYLDAIANAATEADANAAIAALIDQINLQPDDIRAQLAPYFEGILPAQSLGQLDYLSTIASDQAIAIDFASQQVDQLLALASAAEMTNSLLTRIADNGAASNSSAGIPAYASGGWVHGPTTLLAGEAGSELILPSDVSSFMKRTGIPIIAPPRGDSRELVFAVGALSGEVAALRRDNNSGHNNTKSAVTAGAQSNVQAQGKTASTVAAALAAAKSRAGR